MSASSHDGQTGATRNTIQRSLVLEAVRSLHDHPTSTDVYEVVRSKHPTISRATVYRNLGMLADRGDILRVRVPDAADRYDFFNEPHYHAKCRACGRVVDVDMPYESDIAQKVTDAHGFSIEGYEIIFDGICRECQRKAELSK